MYAIQGSYDPWLVALSFLIALGTSYTVLEIVDRITANIGSSRTAWILGGAFAMGSGIWCMHYTGMLAFRLPIPVYYHIPTVGLSLLVAILASSAALQIVTREGFRLLHLVGGSVLMGLGIAGMHYIGMEAMRLPAMHHYNTGVFVFSVFLALAISCVALLLMFLSRLNARGWKWRVCIILLLGMAIPCMHYTGMAAVTFMPMQAKPDLSSSVEISGLGVFAIMMMTFVVLGSSVLTSLIDRRMAEQNVQMEQERRILRALIDNMPDFIYVKDLQSRFVIANPVVVRELGVLRAEDLLGRTDFDFFPQGMARSYYEDEQEVIRSGMPLFNREEDVLNAAGERSRLLTTKVPLYDAKGAVTGIAGIGHNITKRKAVEDALRQAEQKYRGIFDEAIVGIFQIAPDGTLLSVNRAMADIFGYDSPEEMLLEREHGFGRYCIDPARWDELLSLLSTVGRVQNFEYEVIRKGGAKLWISTSIRTIQENGEILRYEGMNHDITERKLLLSQLLRAQKLEAVGQLAAGIAHEINTPTQYIGDNVRFLRDTFKDLLELLSSYKTLLQQAKEKSVTEEAIERVTKVECERDVEYALEEIPRAIDQTLEGIGRISTLVNAMKEFSHPGTKEKTALDLNHAIENTIMVARTEWKYVSELETEFDATLPPVSCHPGEFNQVILNLIVNAAHAIEATVGPDSKEKGKIRIRTRNCDDWAEIRVQDSGCGIPESIQGRIFDPFFTTKEVGKGTGQGLAIARSVIVDQHQGMLDFETTEGVGTTFIVRLPIGSNHVKCASTKS